MDSYMEILMSLERIERGVRHLLKGEAIIMGEQAAVDADVQVIDTAVSELGSAQAAIQTELDNLQNTINQGGAPNLEALTAAVGKLSPAVQAVAALHPANAPAPAPPAEAPAAPAPEAPAAQ